MSIKIPRRKLLDLINLIRAEPLELEQCQGAFQRIEDVLGIYRANSRDAKKAPKQREKRKAELKHFKEALEAALLWGDKAGVSFELDGVAEFDQLKQSAKKLLGPLEKLLVLPMSKGTRPDERKWAMGQLAEVFKEVTGKVATNSYDYQTGEYSGDFFKFAQLCFSNMKPQPFPTAEALGAASRDALRVLRGKREGKTE